MKKWSVIFDWDGVIIDSSSYHEKSWEMLSQKRGLFLPPGHFRKGFGMQNRRIIPEILGWSQDPEEIEMLSEEKERYYRQILDEEGIEPLFGVLGLLSDLKKYGISFGVGTSSSPENLDLVLKKTVLGEYFDVFVTCEDVKKGKPDPEVFFKVAKKLETEPDFCVVFEDSHSGLEAAKKAGMKAVGVATTHPKESLNADLVIEKINEVNIEILKNLWKIKKSC